SIASKSAGPGTRANIDEFTETTANALSKVGGAEHGKAIIILNPAEPPMKMRDTVLTLSKETDKEKVTQSVHAMVELVQEYVPGYQLKQDIQFEVIGSDKPITIPGVGKFSGLKTTVFLEIEGAAHYLPSYAGNLDIMTSAAMRTAEHFAAMRIEREVSHA
ncbi:MAG: acetaldehyde dehydrogenase (acetylating), partial [Pseudomonadales bacterium]